MLRFDANRMGAALGFPGIDPRNWLALAVVQQIKIDATGAKADVAMFPDERPETVAIGGAIGRGHGLFVPVAVGQLVIVAFPHGTADAGGVIIGSEWDGGQAPPARVVANPDATALVGVDGKTMRLIGQGDAGHLVLESTAGTVYVGLESASLGAARETDTVRVTIPPGVVMIQNPVAPPPPPFDPILNPVPILLSGSITSGSAKVRIS